MCKLNKEEEANLKKYLGIDFYKKNYNIQL